MMTWKRTILLAGFIIGIAGGMLFYFNVFDLLRIKGVLKGAEEAVEQEDLEQLMSYVSIRYADPYGFDNPMARRFMSGLFKDFDKFEVAVEKPVIHIEGNTATVRLSLWISVDWDGHPAYLVGTNRTAAPVRAYLKKEFLRWKVVKIEGVR